MKQLLPALLLLCTTSLLHAQRGTFITFGVGYNAALMRSDGLDYVIKGYNTMHANFGGPLENCRFYDGVAVYAAVGIRGLYVDAGFVSRSCKVSSRSIDDNGTVLQRDLKNKFNTLNLGVGWTAVAQPRFGLGFGVGTALGFDKVLTRIGKTESIQNAGYGKPVSQFKAAFEPFITIITASRRGRSFMIKPYVSWTPFKTDYRELNKKINPDGYKYDTPKSVQSQLMGFGATVTLNMYQTLHPKPKPEQPERDPNNVFR
jgi:hypothetical protein